MTWTIEKRKWVIIGIDPGVSGAVAAITGEGEVIGLVDTPIIKAGGKALYNVSGMAEKLRGFAIYADRGGALAVLEQAQAMPGQGVSSTFSTGRSFGLWEGILGALEIPFITVRPSVWVKSVLTGVAGQGKERSIKFAMQAFPFAELIPEGCRKPRDGRADALCLAWYGMERMRS